MATPDRPAVFGVVDDDTLDPTPAQQAGPPTDLELIAAELTAELDTPPLRLDVPTRPGWAVVFDVNISAPALASWQKRSADPGWPDGIDQLKLAAIVIANQARDVVRAGVSTGYSFRNRAFLELLKAPDARNAVLKMYGRDAAVMQTAERVLIAAGHMGGSDLGDGSEDPTARP